MGVLLALVLVSSIIQPLEAYKYFNLNSPKNTYNKIYYFFRLALKLPDEKKRDETLSKARSVVPLKAAGEYNSVEMYMSLRNYSFLRRNTMASDFDRYIRFKIIAYDYIKKFDIEKDFDEFEESFRRLKNVAYISTDSDAINDQIQPIAYTEHPVIITDTSSEVKVVDYLVNRVKMKTNFKKEKFLVYNDNYHSKWHAFIDGKEADLYRTNLTFKGLWVPAGEHTVLFRYGSLKRILLNYLLLVVFYSMFIFLVILWRKERELQP